MNGIGHNTNTYIYIRAQRCANCLQFAPLDPNPYFAFGGDCQYAADSKIECRNVWNVACSTLIISIEAFEMPNNLFYFSSMIFFFFRNSPFSSMSWLFTFFFFLFVCFANRKIWYHRLLLLCNRMIYMDGMDVNGINGVAPLARYHAHEAIGCNYFWLAICA